MTEPTTRERIGGAETPEPPRHPDVSSWRPATADDVEAIMTLALAADRVDHPAWVTPREEIDDVFASSWIEPARDTLLGVDADGRVIASGAAWVHPARDVRLSAHLEGVVHPDFRGRGIGRELLRWEHERALQALVELDSPLPAEIVLYAQETNAAAQAIAVRRGFARERWFTTMVRDLADEIPEIEASAVARIVAYDPVFKEATRRARNDAFRDHWGSLDTPAERWSQFVDGDLLRPDLSRIALEGDRVVALALGSVNEDDWAGQGYSSVYIDLVGVTRDRRGLRLAPLVITALLRAARAAGLEKAVLDVDTESPTGANSLYHRLGFEPTERTVALVAHI